MAKKQAKKSIKIKVNDNLPILLVDNLTISTRSDGLHIVRFTTQLQEGIKEQARMMIPENSMKAMLDVLCSHSNYYPAKPRSKKKK